MTRSASRFVARRWSLVFAAFLIVAAFLLAAGVALARAFRIRIETSGECVRVVNYWRTFEFTWADVKDVGSAQ